jgi:hypothetical protein
MNLFERYALQSVGRARAFRFNWFRINFRIWAKNCRIKEAKMLFIKCVFICAAFASNSPGKSNFLLWERVQVRG